MKERGIVFRAEMVLAILDGRKTQTRRVMKPQPVLGRPWRDWTIDPDEMDLPLAYCPYGIARDRLWVRETLFKPANDLDKIVYKYRADASKIYLAGFKRGGQKWTPSIFMPRWASRITLEITDVRVERVQDISMDDALREGADPKYISYSSGSCENWFKRLWNSINAKEGFGWDVNPWVWKIEFSVV